MFVYCVVLYAALQIMEPGLRKGKHVWMIYSYLSCVIVARMDHSLAICYFYCSYVLVCVAGRKDLSVPASAWDRVDSQHQSLTLLQVLVSISVVRFEYSKQCKESF